MSRRQLLASMSSRELTEWQMFYHIEPFGGERADLQAGIVASTIANVNRGKGSKVFSPADFMPFAEKPRKKKQTEAEIEAALDRFAAAYNIPKVPPGEHHDSSKQT